MSSDARALDVASLAVGAPKERPAQPALHVGGADSDCANFDHQLTRFRSRHWDLLNPVVFGSWVTTASIDSAVIDHAFLHAVAAGRCGSYFSTPPKVRPVTMCRCTRTVRNSTGNA